MRTITFAAIAALMMSGAAFAADVAPQPVAQAPAAQSAPPATPAPPTVERQNCAPECVVKTIVDKKVVGYKYKTVKVPIYQKTTKQVKVQAQPVEIDTVKVPEPEPQVVKVKRKIVVVEEPEIIRAPSPPITVLEAPQPRFVERPPIMIAPPPPAYVARRPVCCPPGANIPNLPPCPPNAGAPVGPTAQLGTPGGGYVQGAPRNAAECRARGGTDTGRGCDGYR